MNKVAYLNSRFIKFRNAKIHIEDRGLQFSDSVYEVVPFYLNKFIDFNYHIERLKYSLNELDLKFHINSNKLKKIFIKLIEKNNIQSGLIYLQITRGIQKRDHAYKDNYIPNIIIYCMKKKFNLPNKSFEGKTAITTKDLRWKRRDIKSVSLLANILAKKIAAKKGAYEAILIENNIVTEGTSSNVWIVKNNILKTHPSNNNILKGITRDSVKKLVKEEKIKFQEKAFTINQLFKSDEVFVTSSASFVTPIVKIDNKIIKNGKIGSITSKLSKIYFAKIKNK